VSPPRSRSALVNELITRAEPLMLIGAAGHVLFRFNSEQPLWLTVLAGAVLLFGLTGVALPQRPWATARSIVGGAFLCIACAPVPMWQRLEYLPWFGVLAIGYPLLLGFQRALPVIVVSNVGFVVFAFDELGALGTTLRVVFYVVGGGAAGLIAEARFDALGKEERASEQALEATRTAERLRAVIDAAPVGIMIVDTGYNIVSNAKIGEFLGGVTAGMAELERTVHDDDRHVIEEIRSSVIRGETVTRVVRARHHEHGARLAEVTAAPVWAVDRQYIESAVIILRDIQDDTDNRRGLERFRAVADMTSDLIGISSTNGSSHYLNPAAQQFFGTSARSAAELISHIPSQYRARMFVDAAAAVERGQTWFGEVELIDSTGRRTPMSAVVVGVRNTSGELEGYAVSYRDLSERKQLEARLAFEARHDVLTGLPNRQDLLEVLDELLHSGTDAAIMFCDIDRFKVVNDSLGHDTGDEVLRLIAGRLRAAAREEDIVGRLGGDEFLVVSRDVGNLEEIAAVAERIIAVVSEPLYIRGREHVLSISIGVATNDGGVDAGTIVQRADLAMYASKQAGRGRMSMYDEEMRIRADERLNVERELRHALETDQIEVRYQPVVSLPDRTPIGFEALVRWNHPVRGLLGPSQFLNVAEASGLVVQLGETVIQTACAALAALRRTAPDVTMSINLSREQLADDAIVQLVTRALARNELPASSITIEITEEIAMHEVQAARPKLDELRRLGVRLAIDDFGTGHSNLALLRNLSADFVKIDRSLIDGLGSTPGDAQLVRLILSLTEELGFAPVAEGISEEAQLDELLRLNCRLAQGHLFGLPMTLVDAVGYLDRFNLRATV
jgi:diguanylate cyclase (GGDEF)-like protein/PAS domain S-box-containing protein